MAGRSFIFTLTTGRSGTAFLPRLIHRNVPSAICLHEILRWDGFGVDAPDLSHMTLFNSQGNIPQVQDFWSRKLSRIARTPTSVYCESSHLLMKCGLVENLQPLLKHGDIHLVEITRDIYSTVVSLRRRGDFMNVGNIWMWYLDPAYPKNILKVRQPISPLLSCVWYVLEIRARAAYYRRLLADRAGVHVHATTLEAMSQPAGAAALLCALGLNPAGLPMIVPAPQNVGGSAPLTAQEEDETRRAVALVEGVDAEDAGRTAYERGVRFDNGGPASAQALKVAAFG